jgi:hypothetical protein
LVSIDESEVLAVVWLPDVAGSIVVPLELAIWLAEFSEDAMAV